MTRLTKSDIKMHRTFLIDWRKPIVMEKYVNDINDYMGSTDFMTQAGIEFLRDSWVAGKFAKIRGANFVRLVSDEWPDFEIQLNSKVHKFECTEADEIGRRRGDEYRNAETVLGPDSGLVEDDSVEDWIERANQVPVSLRLAIEKKIRKRYGSIAQLVINLNINEFGIRQKEIESCFQGACEAALNHFGAVWILWKNKVYGPFASASV